jgi:hypothetical protein
VRASLILIGVAFLFVGAIFVAIGSRTLLEERRYQQRGASVEAIATGKTLRRATETSNTAYEISFRFRLPDGSSQVRSERVPVRVWEGIDADSPLTVEYLRDDPASARVVRERDDLKPAALWLLLGSALVLGGLTAIKRSFKSDAVDTSSTSPPRDTPVAQEPSFWPLVRRTTAFWFGGFILSCGVPAVLAGGWQLYEDATFRRQARATPGVVLTKEIKRSGNQKRIKRYEVTYRYTVGGETFEARDVLVLDRWARLIEREPTDVLYRAQKPRSSRLAGPRPWLLGTVVIVLFGALFTGIGATFFIGAIRRARLEWRLRQSGVSTPGTVVELRELPLKINDVQQWRLHYRYRDLRGRDHDKAIDVPEDEATLWKVGDACKVLYDSAQPAEAVWLGRDQV